MVRRNSGHAVLRMVKREICASARRLAVCCRELRGSVASRRRLCKGAPIGSGEAVRGEAGRHTGMDARQCTHGHQRGAADRGVTGAEADGLQ